jgi:hypothetical protein
VSDVRIEHLFDSDHCNPVPRHRVKPVQRVIRDTPEQLENRGGAERRDALGEPMDGSGGGSHALRGRATGASRVPRSAWAGVRMVNGRPRHPTAQR